MAKKINGIEVIDICSSSDEEDESPFIPYRSINSAMKDENKRKQRVIDDDCLILDFNPFESIDKLSINDAKESEDEDLTVVAEIGQVACRDYPHSRHLCVKFPFNKTPHSSYCKQCYCYVCDSIAPCKYWYTPVEHCHATANDSKWKILRENRRLDFCKDPTLF
ncbi:hypothetical protein C5167_019688 [Papaver somniferum]|uniref:Uncharacterized protein n=1 Tax=Papaver somniferum TaxID=3469 RepID=A0A4Y7IT02_PAPSO|nr:uncharacterized protein LOC113353940 [Papaver somniferum]RZC51266.1 hypothetical protein C5167_019688 [Papaver somniferum]